MLVEGVDARSAEAMLESRLQGLDDPIPVIRCKAQTILAHLDTLVIRRVQPGVALSP
ncbi:hypothetical protein NB231_14138 [Nitrococcus mobilis Nb-231]|uniref:Uncharacterized protein n=1 Tax=Nitrococcus mobilis Nb-231 TaxID=314278 RepID=A4BKX8_9GAMM|nr:hypothetical protein NB231_14138 [Nitrococcus mobilis Nb-231]